MTKFENELLNALNAPKDETKKDFFYYDETNNIRKFCITGRGFNTDLSNAFFILGGLLIDQRNPPDIESLWQQLDLQKTVHEVKFKNLIGGSRAFKDVISSKRIQTFFHWMVNSRVLIHFNALDLLYFSVVDIVDFLPKSKEQFELVADFSFNLKDALYKTVRKDVSGYQNVLARFNYPNVRKSDSIAFLSDVYELISRQERADNDNDAFFRYMLLALINSAKKNKELPFLEDNKGFQLVENFLADYILPMTLFPNSKHIYDHETEIERKISELEKEKGPFNNYVFVDSKQFPQIQLSDVFVGFLAKLMNFAYFASESELTAFKKDLKAEEAEVLVDFRNLLDMSDACSPLTIVFTGPISFREKVASVYSGIN